MSASPSRVTVLPNSHKAGALPHTTTQPDGQIQVQLEQSNLSADSAVTLDLEPGDLLLFSSLLVTRNSASQDAAVGLEWTYQDSAKPTLAASEGHIVRSFVDMDREVQSAKEWAAAPVA
jgi:hypothetical protein